MPRGTGRIDLDVEDAFGNDPPVPGSRNAGVLNGVLEIEEHARLIAGVRVIDQHRTAAKQIAVSLEGDVDGGV